MPIDNKKELTEEDLARITGGEQGFDNISGTKYALLVSALYEKISVFSGNGLSKAKLTTFALQIAGYIQVSNFEAVKDVMKKLKINYTEIYFELIIVCKQNEITNVIPSEDL